MNWRYRFRRRQPQPPAAKWTVWMVSNGDLKIENERTQEHPAIVISTEPELLVIPGSHTKRYDYDSIVVEIAGDLLDPARSGKGLTFTTRFDAARVVPLQNAKCLGTYLGTLNAEGTRRVMDALARPW